MLSVRPLQINSLFPVLDSGILEDMHAILFERKMISGAALPKKVDGERLSKIYENSKYWVVNAARSITRLLSYKQAFCCRERLPQGHEKLI